MGGVAPAPRRGGRRSCAIGGKPLYRRPMMTKTKITFAALRRRRSNGPVRA